MLGRPRRRASARLGAHDSSATLHAHEPASKRNLGREGRIHLAEASDRRPAPAYPSSSTPRSRSALPTTDTELRLIAAAAIIGLSSRPNTG